MIKTPIIIVLPRREVKLFLKRVTAVFQCKIMWSKRIEIKASVNAK